LICVPIEHDDSTVKLKLPEDAFHVILE
jgi:hypothetical protein